jgi:sec-independent protein translocase protein TatA
MGSFSIWHWLVVLLVVLLLFGSGKISGLMGDLAKGIKSFKQNIKEEQPDASMEAQAQGQTQPAGSIQGPAASSTAQTASAQTTPPRPGA